VRLEEEEILAAEGEEGDTGIAAIFKNSGGDEVKG